MVHTGASSRVRVLALGGVVGPLAFVGCWIGAGRATASYSPFDDAISDLTAVGVPTRVVMTVGFVVFGLGLVAFGLALRDVLHGPAWIAAVVTGCSTIGVAATPLGGWSGDDVHALFAGLGYASLVALPLFAAREFARVDRTGWVVLSVATAIVAAASLGASTLGAHHGLWQRVGLTLGDAWIVAVATCLVVPVWSAPPPGFEPGHTV